MRQYRSYTINNFVQCEKIDNKIDRVWGPLQVKWQGIFLDESTLLLPKFLSCYGGQSEFRFIVQSISTILL